MCGKALPGSSMMVDLTNNAAECLFVDCPWPQAWLFAGSDGGGKGGGKCIASSSPPYAALGIRWFMPPAELCRTVSFSIQYLLVTWT